jgi:hypothetical protein
MLGGVFASCCGANRLLRPPWLMPGRGRARGAQGAAVAWLPLGYGHLLLPGAAGLRAPASARRLLWSWAGSVGRKPQREAFLGALRAHAAWPALNASGFLETYDWFGADAGGVAAAAAMYTGLLHDSAFVPCPAGRSAEQFRIWEALVRIPPAARCKARCTTCSHGG